MKKNIVFMGTPEFSANILRKIAAKHNVELVVTQLDKEVGRKKILTPPPVKQVAMELGLELVQPKKIKDNNEFFELIKSKQPDFIIVAAYGKILPQDVLDISFCVNTHASLLPLYRGASPIQTAILNGDKISGVTLMKMDAGLDTGDILYQKEISIENLRSSDVFEIMSDLSSSMLLEFLSDSDSFIPKKQNNDLATFTKIIEKCDGLVDFSNARNLYNKYLAYDIWPNIFLKNGLRLIDVELVDEFPNTEAGVIKELYSDGFVVSCEVGSVKIKKLQQPGKNILSAKDYLNGKRMKVGDKIEI